MSQLKKNNYPLESNPHKKIFFLLALPRSGNTLFGSIMNQNPDIAVTANSITLEIMKKYKNGSLFKFQNKLNKDIIN